MRKLTANELMRNAMYAEVGEADFGDFKAVGNVKQGFLFKNDEGKSVIVKVIVKKSEVDFDVEATERPTENVEGEPEADEDVEETDEDVEEVDEDVEDTGDEEA
jgi:hypothetical protein